MLLPLRPADTCCVRLGMVYSTLAVALVAVAIGLVPLLLSHHPAPRPGPPVNAAAIYAVPIMGGRLIPASRISPAPKSLFRAAVRRGELIVRNPSGSVAWRRPVAPGVVHWAVGQNGRVAVLVRAGGVVLVTPRAGWYLARGGGYADPSFSVDGGTVYLLRVNAATSIPK